MKKYQTLTQLCEPLYMTYLSFPTFIPTSMQWRYSNLLLLYIVIANVPTSMQQRYFDPVWLSSPPQWGHPTQQPFINVSMCYVQWEDGTIINGHVAKTICQHAHSIFIIFTQQGQLLTVWSDVDANCCSYYYDEMATHFEELGFCDYDWKANQIAMNVYPSWTRAGSQKDKKLIGQRWWQLSLWSTPSALQNPKTVT